MSTALTDCMCVVVFRPGKEYLYRYESQVLSGIRALGNQMSGLKIHANLKLQIHRDGNAILKVGCFTWQVCVMQQ